MWELLDQFKVYAGAIEQQMLENMSKLYIGKKVLFDIQEVEQQLVQIEARMGAFLSKYSADFEAHQESIDNMDSARGQLEEYIAQVRTLYKEIEGGYGPYLRRRLQRRSREIDRSIAQLRSALLA
jgi:hypothetical protein